MQLVLISHRGRASLKIAHVGIVVSHNERTLKLTRVTGIDTEIRAEFHRTTHALGDIYKRTVTEHSTVQSSKEIVAVRNYGTKILSDEVWMLLDSFADGTENDAFLAQFLLEGGLHRDRIHDSVNRCISAQGQAFLQRNAQLVESLLQLGINLSVTGWLLCHRIGIIGDLLIINRRHMHMSPLGFCLLFPIAESAETELQHPFWFPFLSRDEPNDILIQPLLDDFRMYVRRETKLIFLLSNTTHKLIIRNLLFGFYLVNIILGFHENEYI